MMHPLTRFEESRVRNDAPLVLLQCALKCRQLDTRIRKSRHADREVLTRK